MKKLTFLALAISASFVFAQQTGPAAEECIDCINKRIKNTPADEVKVITDVAEKISDESLAEFAKLLCSTARRLSRGDSISKSGSIIENEFIKKFGINKKDKDYKKQVADIYNKYADKLICIDTPTPHTRSPEQFIKRVISLGMYEYILYDFLLYDEEEYPIDVNTVEVVDGKKETVLDYIDNILADPEVSNKYDVAEIKDLRGLLIEDFKAKKANDL